jgi:hypothetical protein
MNNGSLRVTEVPDDRPVIRDEAPSVSLNPVKIFVDKDRTALLWFVVAAVACVAAVIQPIILAQQSRQQERVVVIDPAGTYYIAPLLSPEDAKELHTYQTQLATAAFLERNPERFDNRELLAKLYGRLALAKADDQLKRQSSEFKAKQLHQKVEVGEINVLQTRDNFILTESKGQLIRTGVFENKPFVETLRFRMAFKMAKNPDMRINHRFPTYVVDFNFYVQ